MFNWIYYIYNIYLDILDYFTTTELKINDKFVNKDILEYNYQKYLKIKNSHQSSNQYETIDVRIDNIIELIPHQYIVTYDSTYLYFYHDSIESGIILYHLFESHFLKKKKKLKLINLGAFKVIHEL